MVFTYVDYRQKVHSAYCIHMLNVIFFAVDLLRDGGVNRDLHLELGAQWVLLLLDGTTNDLNVGRKKM